MDDMSIFVIIIITTNLNICFYNSTLEFTTDIQSWQPLDNLVLPLETSYSNSNMKFNMSQSKFLIPFP